MLADAARDALLKVEALREKADDLAQRHAEEQAKLLKPIKKQWTALLKDQQAETDALNVSLKAAEAHAKQCTIELGATVKGDHLMCCYQAGRITWNTDRLIGLMAACPNIDGARTVGQPSATFRNC